MASERQSAGWLPGILAIAGLFFLVSGFNSTGPDVVGGMVFGGVTLAAAAAILLRRSRDAAKQKGDDSNPPISDRPEKPDGLSN